MRVETTRTAIAVQLQHAAGFHGSSGHLLSQLIPLAEAGLASGSPVAAALSPATEAALLDALGHPHDLILLPQPHGPDAGSGQTVAAMRARELRELTVRAGSVTMLSEHWSALDGVDGSFWTELDAALNLALADLPIGLTCFFPEMPLHQAILDGARRNHPQLLVGGRLHHNPDHLLPREVLAELPAAVPELLGAPDLQMAFGAWQLGEVRAAVEQVLLATDYTRTRAEDVVLAVNEVATNAVEHGANEARLCLWASADGFVCEVHDSGLLRDPLPGLQAPHPSDPRGRGIWIARQLCDTLHVWSDETGTHVRMRAAR